MLVETITKTVVESMTRGEIEDLLDELIPRIEACIDEYGVISKADIGRLISDALMKTYRPQHIDYAMGWDSSDDIGMHIVKRKKLLDGVELSYYTIEYQEFHNLEL